MEHTTPKPPALSPLEVELLSLVNALEARLTQLEASLKADSATAQAQRQSMSEQLQDLHKRLASLELSSTSLLGYMTAFERQFLDLEGLFATHRLNYNNAITAFRKMQKTWQDHQDEYQALQSQVARLTAELRSLGA